MKAKHRRKNLELKQKWFDALPNNVKNTMTRPGSVKKS